MMIRIAAALILGTASLVCGIGAAPRGSALSAVAPPGALSPAEAMRAFGVVEGWVRRGAVDTPEAGLPAVHGAAVTIRVDGKVVGRGVGWSLTEASGPAIRVAAAGAIAEAAALDLGQSDAMLEAEARSRFWSAAAISVEFAGALVPLDSPTYDDVDADVRPGVEGVAVRRGGSTEAVFPGAMLARNIGPGDALVFAVSRVSGDAGAIVREDPGAQPAKLGESRGVRCYRFRTVHIAHPSPGTAPVFLDRGGRLISPWPRSGADLKEWAGLMARHLIMRRRVEAGHVEYAGVYRPVTGVYDPPPDSSFEEALIARALLAYAAMPGADPDLAKRAERSAVELADTVLQRAENERGVAASPASAAMWACLLPRLAAVRRPPADPTDASTWPAEWTEGYRRALAALASAGAATTSPGERAVVTFALARRAGEKWPEVRDDEAPAARRSLASLLEETPPGRLASLMPWVGWGELCLEGEVPAAAALREFRDSVYSHQLRAESLDADNADLAGGVVFTASRSPLPTWHTARVAAFLGSALADGRITAASERAAETARLTATLRFLRQLTADGACGFMYADAARAAGGVRSALWDQHQPSEATSLSLIAACETLRAASGAARTP